MERLTRWFQLIIFLFLSLLFYDFAFAKQCPSKERVALLSFKKTLSSSEFPVFYSKLNTWNESTDCCSWDGVTCDEFTDHVIGLDLSCGWFRGTIHSNSSLFLLSYLRSLNLAYNQLDDSLMSSKFRSFQHLNYLNLTRSGFSGRVSPEISHLSKLVSLDLSSTDLMFDAYSFSKMAQNLTDLRVLDLSLMDMSSVAPHSLLNLSSTLRSLRLKGCNMRGKVSTELFHFPSLEVLDLYDNILRGTLPKSNWSTPLRFLDLERNCYFTGEIPNSIGNLRSIKYLDLSFNNFSGVIPESFGKLSQFEHLDISYNNFLGQIPKSFGNLTKLVMLDLSFNNFIGPLPSSIENCVSLIKLYVSHNHLNGSLPSTLGKLSNLTHLFANKNNFDGKLPLELGKLGKLEVLSVHYNMFNGQIPLSIFNNLTKLREIKFSFNELEGPLPNRTYGLKNLNELCLDHNSFNGRIPTSFFTLPLRHLDLSYNKFIGFVNQLDHPNTTLEFLDLSNNEINDPIPSCVYRLVRFERLRLSSNNLSGSIEWNNFSSLKFLRILNLSSNAGLSLTSGSSLDFTMPELISLSLSSCNMTEFPYYLKTLKSLEILDLSRNRIRGKISGELGGWQSLRILNLSQNLLTSYGQLPWMHIKILDLRSNLLQGHLVVPPAKTKVFMASGNKLIGSIPSSFCNLSYLSTLDLSDNFLSGVIPQCLCNFSDFISILNLRNNMLQGFVPGKFKKFNSIVHLNFNGNELEGPLPRSLVNCKELEVLDLGNNKINDTFPFWLQTLPYLQALVLRSNKFHGIVPHPKVLTPFHKLRIFNLSHNNFSGPFPRKLLERLESFRKLSKDGHSGLYMGQSEIERGYHFYYEDTLVLDITMKGMEFELKRILTIFTVIDLSNNQFHGNISKAVGKLKSLKVLNFSHNNFTGHIPSSLGKLSELESLDLSHNNLVGQIPPQLTDLTFLSFLNLSYNKLEGAIPHKNQLNTFENSSYIGNLGLCGCPLTKECSHIDQPPTFHEEEAEEEDYEGWFDWKFSLMGYVCGLVFGLSMSYVVFTTNKPWWFVKKVLKIETYLTEGRRNRRRRRRRTTRN